MGGAPENLFVSALLTLLEFSFKCQIVSDRIPGRARSIRASWLMNPLFIKNVRGFPSNSIVTLASFLSFHERVPLDSSRT
jgi:hypothetical protein